MRSPATSRPTDPDGLFAPEVRPAIRRTIERGSVREEGDLVACEEPLEIQLGPASLAVVMRTPGHDEELALGFAMTERIVSSPKDVLSIRHCSTALHPESEDNLIRIVLAPHVEVDLARLRRNLYASSSCGICGKATIENVLSSAPPLDDDRTTIGSSVVCGYPASLAKLQDAFRSTGGLHAAGLFDARGQVLVVREDVGRHNAVDKVVGWAAARGLTPLSGHALMVSGRVSYEIVQKALAARIPVVAAVSAPSSLAIDLAAASGIAVVGFVRGDAMNVYSNEWRILP